jgi:spore germination protein
VFQTFVRIVVALGLWAVAVPLGAVPLFQEVWGYLAPGAEFKPVPSIPVTDWAFFGAELNSQGELAGLPTASRLRAFPGRVHLVFAIVDSYSQVHMAVYPGFPVRAALLDALAAAARPYDGVQIDFETVSSRDQSSYWSFLADLKARLGPKTLSVALPARTSRVDDAFEYTTLETLADRIIVMAYDEHWGGGTPGPIASLDWGARVVAYTKTKIGKDKLVMGAPFYGRSWAERPLSRAYTFSGISSLLQTKGLPVPGRENGIPFFEYDETVRVRVYYEDKESQATRMQLYAASGVTKVAFWRVGQEDPGVWDQLGLVTPVPLLWPRAPDPPPRGTLQPGLNRGVKVPL